LSRDSLLCQREQTDRRKTRTGPGTEGRRHHKGSEIFSRSSTVSRMLQFSPGHGH
jgi:hypothetical protein